MSKPRVSYKKLCLELDPGCVGTIIYPGYDVHQWQIRDGAGQMIAFDTARRKISSGMAWMHAYFVLAERKKMLQQSEITDRGRA